MHFLSIPYVDITCIKFEYVVGVILIEYLASSIIHNSCSVGMPSARSTISRCVSKHANNYIGSVYFITEVPFSGKIKIGRSKNIRRRCQQLQVGNPNKLAVLHHITTNDNIALEKQLHAEFHRYHIRGEWFAISQETALAVYRRYYY